MSIEPVLDIDPSERNVDERVCIIPSKLQYSRHGANRSDIPLEAMSFIQKGSVENLSNPILTIIVQKKWTEQNHFKSTIFQQHKY